jgi:Putative Ig domain
VHRGRRVLGVVLATLVTVPFALGARAVPPPHVAFIGDSVADALQLDTAARAELTAGTDADLELAACRRLDGESCPSQDGVRPPTALQLIASTGTDLGPTVVIAVGYNDYEDVYPQEIESTLAALQAAGVQHVFWLTLRQTRHPYITMDDAILASAARHPDLVTVVDWNVYARGHDEWFAPDGIHLADAGAEAMARLVHGALVDAGIVAPAPAIAPPPRIKVATFKLPVARVHAPYAAKLTASGGRAPYRWTAVHVPNGLRLASDGSLVGRPAGRPGAFRLWFTVHDAGGRTARRRLTLTIR